MNITSLVRGRRDSAPVSAIRSRSRIAHEGVITRATAVAARVNALRALQDASGRVVKDHARAFTIVQSLPQAVASLCDSLGQGSFGAAFGADTATWITRGIDTAPLFDRVRAAFRSPAEGTLGFFCGPLLTTNGPEEPGYRMEAFLALRDEPKAVQEIARRYPHPKNACQAGRFVIGSDGLRLGNCIVFFPENIPASTPATSQSYAFFFFNKFQPIFERETMPRVVRLFGDEDQLFGGASWIATNLTPAACYEARAVWGYLHDYFHHKGPRPLDRHLQVKLGFFPGLLDEIKTDCQTILAAANDPHIPWRREIVEHVFFERMLRYPGQPDAAKSFDAGTGVLLFEWLAAAGAIAESGQTGELVIHLEAALDAMALLVWRISELEHLRSDAEYTAACERFVRTLLPPADDKADARFSMPATYTRLVGIEATKGAAIQFDHVPLY